MGATIAAAEKVARVANGLIADHHPRLRSVGILYATIDSKIPKRPKPLCKGFGSVRVLDSYAKFWSSSNISSDQSDYELQVTMNLTWWLMSNEEQRIAAVDHMLEHFWFEEPEVDDGGEPEGDGSWQVLEHDISEFAGILERHGLWNDPLKAAAARASQVNLPGFINVGVSSEPRADGAGERVRSVTGCRMCGGQHEAVVQTRVGEGTKDAGWQWACPDIIPGQDETNSVVSYDDEEGRAEPPNGVTAEQMMAVDPDGDLDEQAAIAAGMAGSKRKRPAPVA